MTIRECYGELGLDFDAVLSRLVNEKLVQKFALKFLDDPSFQNLKDALDSKDVETARRRNQRSCHVRPAGRSSGQRRRWHEHSGIKRKNRHAKS